MKTLVVHHTYIHTYIHTKTIGDTHTQSQSQSYLSYHKEQTKFFDRIRRVNAPEDLQFLPLEHRQDKVLVMHNPLGGKGVCVWVGVLVRVGLVKGGYG